MRSFSIPALTAVGVGLAATSSAFAAPITPVSIVKSDSRVSHLTTVHYRGWGWGGFAAGAAAGAIIGGILAAPYYAPGYGAYSGDAVRYCMQRFRSYDPGSGTYLGYDGYRHPCP
jgi:hypothetical protein